MKILLCFGDLLLMSCRVGLEHLLQYFVFVFEVALGLPVGSWKLGPGTQSNYCLIGWDGRVVFK